MNSLFNPDNPFMRFLARVGELIILNFLFLLCCIPVITAGAAAAALQKACQVILFDEDDAVTRVFFRAFRENFKQATIAWLVILFFLVGTVCDYLLIASFFTGGTAMLFNAVITALLILVLGIASHLFPLMVRYENRLMEHVKNAVILSIIKLPRTLGMVVLNILPVIVAFFSMQVLMSTMVFWLVIGFAFAGYMCATLMRPIFAELETGDKSKIQIMN